VILGLAIAVAALLLYAYAGYPLLLWLVSLPRRARRAHRPGDGPSPSLVSIVVAARDEEEEIGAKIDDILAQEVPGELEVIVVSDASGDRTDEIVRSHPSGEVRLVRQEGRRGKTACRNRGLAEARGDVVVLTDCGSRMEKGAVRELAAAFADPRVGCAGGRIIYREGGPSQGPLAGAWRWIWEMEHRLRRLESRAAGLVGVSGSLCALRREGAPRLREDLLDDWPLGPMTVASGRRSLYVPGAVAREAPSASLGEDARRRLRIAVQTIHTLWATLPVWASPRRPLFALQAFSHKALRYLTPFLLLALPVLVAAGFLAAHTPAERFGWAVAVGVLAAVFSVAGLGLARGAAGRRTLLWPLGYGLFLQAVLLAGWWRWLLGERVSGWSPEREAAK